MTESNEIKIFLFYFINTGAVHSEGILKIIHVTYVVNNLKLTVLFSLTRNFPYRYWRVLNSEPEYLVEVRLGKAFRHNFWHLQHCSEITSNSRVR